ncbi:MAG: ABC-F family ATP-binding cassette domain-containing protein [Bdellovibrionales bacterium]|nr:ABC-F family ATP-binding cassette domain-containing protein [Bdellovibrionales bacterium]
MIQVSNLKKTYGSRVLFEGLTFSLNKGDRVGLVGRNGSGKSTLIKIIVGLEEADEGQITQPQNYKIGYLDQHIHFTKNQLLEECIQALPKEQEHDFYRAEKILFGLGFSEDDMQKQPTQFSGGYQLRINLTKCLLAQPDLLILDEPTNYLDILSLQWMKRFLKSFPGEVLIITHDREFMDEVTTHTMGINRKKLLKVQGSTDKYYEQLAADEEIYEKTRLNQERKLEQLNRFVERFRAKASKATQAQSVAKRIAKMSILSQMESEQMMGFRFNYKESPAKRVMDVQNLSFGFDKNDLLFKELSFDVKIEDRIAIIGKNGKGKSTLLNVLAGNLTSLAGEIKTHPATKIGYYQQTHRKDLHPSWSVDEEIQSANIELGLSEVRAICGAMMFPGDDAKKKISVLSGGEQSRVLLGKVLAQPSNLLLLDEPTNHLDMESIEVLTEEIDAFPGPVLIVTHSETILHRLANKLIVFKADDCFVFNGNYDEFLEKVGWDDDTPKTKTKVKVDKKEIKRLRAEIIQKRSKELSPLKKQSEECEKQIEKIEHELHHKNELVMSSLNDQSGSTSLQDIYKEIGQLQLQQERAYTELESLISKIEYINKRYDSELNELLDN